MYVITLLRTDIYFYQGTFEDDIPYPPGGIWHRSLEGNPILLQNATLPETSSNRISQNEAGSSPKHPMLQAKLKIVSSTLC